MEAVAHQRGKPGAEAADASPAFASKTPSVVRWIGMRPVPQSVQNPVEHAVARSPKRVARVPKRLAEELMELDVPPATPRGAGDAHARSAFVHWTPTAARTRGMTSA